MATKMTVLNPPPTGVVATYFGVSGGATDYFYFIEAIYPSGRSLLTTSNKVTAVASFSVGNEMLISWDAMAGAIGYNVYRAGTSAIPTVGTNFLASVTGNAFTDNGVLALAAGQVIIDGLIIARARYSFAVDGDPLAPGLITLAQSDIIPLGAIMVGGTIKVTTAVLSAGAATVAIGTSAGSSASSILAATAKASLSLNAILNVVPVFATPVAMTAAGQITITSATAALTAGVIDIIILYLMPLS